MAKKQIIKYINTILNKEGLTQHDAIIAMVGTLNSYAATAPKVEFNITEIQEIFDKLFEMGVEEYTGLNCCERADCNA